MKTLEENIKGIRDFMDEDTYQFYKGVIQEYATESSKNFRSSRKMVYQRIRSNKLGT